jgi:pyocin large subunit-like protein
MTIKPQSIRNGITVKFNNVVVNKQDIITKSESWNPNHEILFKKLLKQGGSFNINGVRVEITPVEKVVNSKGETDVKPFKIDTDARF